MTRWKSKLKQLQDVYADALGVSVALYDHEGDALLDMTDSTGFLSLIFGSRGAATSLSPAVLVKYAEEVRHPVLYECELGISFIVAPICHDTGSPQFAVAGPFLECGRRKMAVESLKRRKDSSSGDGVWEWIVHSLPDTTEEQKDKALQRIGEFARLAEEYMGAELEREQTEQYKKLLNRVLAGGNAEFPAGRLLDFMKAMRLDFAGLALQQSSGHYRIESVVGAAGAFVLEGESFVLGEGLLGHAAMTGQPECWHHVDGHPRASMFVRKGVVVKSLLCYPLRQEEKVRGLVFGGTAKLQSWFQGKRDWGQLLSAALNQQLHIRELKKSEDSLRMKLSSLLDITRVMSELKDAGQIVAMMVDMVHSLVRGTFCCVVLNQGDGGHVKTVSRQLSAEQADVYAEQVRRRYFGTPDGREFASMPRTARRTETAWAESVGEFPIVYRNQIKGVLAIGAGEGELAAYESFIGALAVTGGIHLHFMQLSERGGRKDEASILCRAVEAWSSEAYLRASRTAELAEGFAERIGLKAEDKSCLLTAAMLSAYTPSFLRTVLDRGVYEDVILCLEQMAMLEERNAGNGDIGASSYSIKSIVLFLAMGYVKDGVWDHAWPIEMSRLQAQFGAYIAGLEPSAAMNSAPGGQSAAPAYKLSREAGLKEYPSLTPREKEVLGLVIRGMSNPEIAQNLFISSHTVKNHMTRIYEKLGVQDRLQVLAKVYKKS